MRNNAVMHVCMYGARRAQSSVREMDGRGGRDQKGGGGQVDQLGPGRRSRNRGEKCKLARRSMHDLSLPPCPCPLGF